MGLEYTKVDNGFDLNNLENGNIRGEHLINTPKNDSDWFFVSSIALAGGGYAMQEAIKVLGLSSTKYKRTKNAGVWGEWREQVGDKSVIDALLAQKQDVLTAGTGITIQGNTISASGGSFIEILENSETITAIEHVETTGNKTIKTFSFEISGDSTVAINGKLRSELSPFIPLNSKVTSGTLAITTDNKNMFLSKSASSDGRQQATFSFLTINESGGEGGGSHV